MSGTAALISRAYPGAAHDMAILSSHPRQVRDLIGDRKVLADLGYTGGQRYVPVMVVCMPDDHLLKRRRVIVEQFWAFERRLESLLQKVTPRRGAVRLVSRCVLLADKHRHFPPPFEKTRQKIQFGGLQYDSRGHRDQNM